MRVVIDDWPGSTPRDFHGIVTVAKSPLETSLTFVVIFVGMLIFLVARNIPRSPPDDLWFQVRVLESEVPVLVKFGAEWCPPCRKLDPELERLSGKYRGRLEVVVVDIDEKPHLARHYRVSGIPRVFLFDQGQVKKSRVGFADQAELAAWTQPYLR